MNYTRKYRELQDPRRKNQAYNKQKTFVKKYPRKNTQKRLCREYTITSENTETYFSKEYSDHTCYIRNHNGLDEYGNCTGKRCDGKSMVCYRTECPTYKKIWIEANVEGRIKKCDGCLWTITDTPKKEWGTNVGTCVNQIFAKKNVEEKGIVRMITEFLMTSPKKEKDTGWDFDIYYICDDYTIIIK